MKPVKLEELKKILLESDGVRKLYVKDTTAAIILDVGVQTMRNWRSAGNMGPPYVRIGRGSIRYNVGDLIDYAEYLKIYPGR
jgi:hypothetical protein